MPAGAVRTTLALLRRAQEGDACALDELLARYVPRMKRWARGRLRQDLRGALDTDDLVQDTLVDTLKHWGDFEPRHEAAVEVYLRQAVMNRVREAYRTAARKPAAIGFDDTVPATSASPLEAALHGEVIDRYESALQSLEAGDRSAVIARLELGYSFAEIAQLLGKRTADAARKHVHKATRLLVERMGTERGPAA